MTVIDLEKSDQPFSHLSAGLLHSPQGLAQGRIGVEVHIQVVHDLGVQQPRRVDVLDGLADVLIDVGCNIARSRGSVGDNAANCKERCPRTRVELSLSIRKILDDVGYETCLWLPEDVDQQAHVLSHVLT
jgi:hypothetical protein